MSLSHCLRRTCLAGPAIQNHPSLASSVSTVQQCSGLHVRKEQGRVAGAALESPDCPAKCRTVCRLSVLLYVTCLCLPGPPRGTSHPHGDVGVSPHPPACEGWPEPQLSLRLTEAFCTFSPGCNRDLSTRAESSWDRAVVARPAFTDQTKVNLHYLLLGLTDRGSSSWKGLDLIISTSLASKASPKPGNSELMPSVTSNKASGSLPRRFTVSDG